MADPKPAGPSPAPPVPRPLARVVLGVTGGIAAYKAAELARLLVKDGVRVDVVMTRNATRFVTPMTFQALTGRPVATDLWEAGAANAMDHIAISRGADAIVVAPASADFLARLAQGRADDLLATLCLARECPLAVAPAMNRQMWSNPATQRTVAQLAADGVTILGPASGDQACGEVGDGRMVEAQEIFDALVALTVPKSLAGRRVLVTAGPTFEAIDPVRGITNLSSGKMGFALARAAADAGATVTMVAGPTSLPTPAGVERVDVVSAAQMADAVFARVAKHDVFVAVAAVADYRPSTAHERKLKKKAESMTIALEPTVDILARVATGPKPPFCVGFAAESHDLAAHARAKRLKKGIPLIVGNIGPATFGRDENTLLLLDDAGERSLGPATKLALARELVRDMATRLTTTDRP